MSWSKAHGAGVMGLSFGKAMKREHPSMGSTPIGSRANPTQEQMKTAHD